MFTSFIPYVATIIILSMAACGMIFLYRAGKTAAVKDVEDATLKVKNAQDKADSRPSLTAGEIIEKMNKGGL